MIADANIRTVHGVECIVAIHPRYVVLTTTRMRHEFRGRNEDEVRIQLFNWLHRKPRMKTDGPRDIETDARELLQTIRLPPQPVRESSGHYRRSSCRRESWHVSRDLTISHWDRVSIYFGSYRSEHLAKAASIRLCQIINEEIEKRNSQLFPRKLTAAGL